MPKRQCEVPWYEMKNEYITGETSYRKLAEKYGQAPSSIYRKGSEEGWPELRERYRKKLTAKTIEKTSSKLAAARSKKLAGLINAAHKISDAALKALDDDDQFYRYVTVEGRGMGESETVERVFSKMDTKAVKDLTIVVRDLAALMREFYNLPTPSEEESRRIAAERLEIDRARAQKDDGIDKTIVVQLGNAEELAK